MSTTRMLRSGRSVAVGLCALALAGGIAVADVPTTLMEITARIGPLQGTFAVDQMDCTYDPNTQTWSYDLPGPVDFYDGVDYLGSLDTLNFDIIEDPQVNLNFSVQAGPIDTEFFIASALLSFPTINAAQGEATAGITLTDFNAFDGIDAQLTGIGDTGGAYLAQYNGWAGDPFFGPQGTTFVEGITSLTATFGGTDSGSVTVPPWAPIGVPVNDMSSLINFSLTANDLASGTSHYEIIPEPGMALLLALGGLAALRRRS